MLHEMLSMMQTLRLPWIHSDVLQVNISSRPAVQEVSILLLDCWTALHHSKGVNWMDGLLDSDIQSRKIYLLSNRGVRVRSFTFSFH